METGGMQNIVQALAEKAQRDAHEKRVAETTRLLAALYDKASGYTKIIIVVGYAGFFAIWGNVKSDLSKFELLASAFCLSFSLMVFVFWEVAVMLFASRNLSELQKVLQAPANEFEKRLDELKSLEAGRSVRVFRGWYVILLLTILPGLVGGAILMGAFIRRLLAML